MIGTTGPAGAGAPRTGATGTAGAAGAAGASGAGAPGLRTVALVKQVPLGGGTGDLAADGRLRRAGLATEMNPWCRRAVTQAVLLAGGAGGRSTAITMGPPAAADVLREAMACGIDDAVHLCDPALAGSDCLVTARVLAAAIARLGPVDVVLAGHSSVDGNTGAVGAMVAELLGLPFAGPGLSIAVDRAGPVPALCTTAQSEDGMEPVRVRLPAVVSVAERSCTPAKAPGASWPAAGRVRTLRVPDVLGGGRPASPTEVVGVRATPAARRPVVLTGPLDDQVRRAVDLWEERERIGTGPVRARAAVPPRAPAGRNRAVMVLAGGADGSRALLGEAAVLAERAGARVVAVTPDGADAARLGAWGADELLVLGHEAARPVAAALASWTGRHGMPWAVLGAARSWEREILSRLAVRLGSGLMSDLVQVYARAGASGELRLLGAKPSGDATLAEIAAHGPTRIATLRTGFLDLRLPRSAGPPPPVHPLDVAPEHAVRTGPRRPDDDYDALERADAVIGVGLGVDPGHYGELLPLCALLGAELAATRKVTDAGWLPHSRQVGVTARSVAPRLYIALGVSGKANHMAGVARAGTVLAVNTDPDAPIFTGCDAGIVADWREVVPRLTAELERRGHVHTSGSPAARARS